MGLNFFLLIVGLIICFGGIYFRRLVSGFLGFVWGVAIAFAMMVFLNTMMRVDDEMILLVFLVGIVFAVVSAIYYKVMTAINAFFSSFSLSWVFLLALLDSDSDGGVLIAVMLALVVAAFVSSISYKFADYSYIILTAFTGALIASVGLFGIVEGESLDDIFYYMMWYGSDDVIGFVALSTLCLTVLGIFVQLRRLKVITGKNNAAEDTSPATVNTVSVYRAPFGTAPADRTSVNTVPANRTSVNTVPGNKASSNTASQITGAVSEQLKKATETAVPVLKNVGTQVKNASAPALKEVKTELSSTIKTVSTADGQRSLLETLKANVVWLIAPVLAWLVFPMIVNSDAFYYDMPYEVVNLVYYINSLCYYFALGTVVYFVFRRDTAMALAMTVFQMACYLLAYFFQNIRYDFWGQLVCLLWPVVTWAVVHLLNNKLSDDMKAKPAILAAAAFFLVRFVRYWLAYFHFSINLAFFELLELAAAIGAVYLLMRLQSAKAPARKYCWRCGAKLAANDVYCDSCGQKQ